MFDKAKAWPIEASSERTDFWRHGQPGYATLSYLSNLDDWSRIIDAIAGEIAEDSQGAQSALKVLDFGSGSGTTASLVARRLLSTHRLESRWLLYEPDLQARASSQVHFNSNTSIPGSAAIFGSLEKVPEDRLASSVDAVTFVHTTYYLDDFEATLSDISRYASGESIKVVVVAMRNGSPFFLGQPDFCYPFLAEDICVKLQHMGVEYEIRDLRSRLNVPKNMWESDEILLDWRHLLQIEEYPLDQLRRLCRMHLVDSVDLQDAIISFSIKSH